MAPVPTYRSDPGHRSRKSAPRLLPAPASPRMRVLSVLSSSTPSCSGAGRSLFALAARLAERVAFAFATDDAHPENVAPVLAFGKEHGIPVHVGPALPSSRSLDSFSADLAGLLRRPDWDVVEAQGWTNAATNALVLRELGDRALVYTPHYQPSWAGPMPAGVAAHADDTHRRMATRADAVLCFSPWERGMILSQVSGRNHCLPVPYGCDFDLHRPGTSARKPQLLFVGDPADPRKRFDLVLAILPRLLARRPDLKLVVIGPGDERARALIPDALRPACELRGGVGEDELRRAYAESLGVLLFSANEAPGIPILEALAAGTPVFVPEWDPTRSLFAAYQGVEFCPVDDPAATSAVVAASIGRGPDAIRKVLADRDRLRSAFDWDALALRKWNALASAWFTHNYIDHPFRGPAVAKTASTTRKAHELRRAD